MANNFRVEKYRSGNPLAIVLTALFAIQIGCYIVYFILSIIEIAAPDMTLDIDVDPTVPSFLVGLVSIVEIGARLGTIGTFLVWLHRVYGNLSPLKANGLEFTPGWAVGWWFIPFANLVKPYQVVAETWRSSDPEVTDSWGLASIENPWQFPLWWGSWILGNVFGRFSDKAVDSETMRDAYPYLLILTTIFWSVSAALAIWIVRDVTRRQELRSGRIELVGTSLDPPPPPTFSQDV